MPAVSFHFGRSGGTLWYSHCCVCIDAQSLSLIGGIGSRQSEHGVEVTRGLKMSDSTAAKTIV
jgi:hypothetical protein